MCGRPRQSNHTTRSLLENALEVRYAARAMEWLRVMIEAGELRSGDRIPQEHELARLLRISRAGVRTVIDVLVTIGVVKVRHRTGAFVALNAEELSELSSEMNRYSPQCDINYLYETRLALQGNVAALAAERRDAHFLPRLAEELMELYATVNRPREFRVHEMVFHRIVAQASGNPVLFTLMTKISTAFYDALREAPDSMEDLQASADRHRKIYRAIRDGKPAAACEAMETHLRLSWVQFRTETSSID